MALIYVNVLFLVSLVGCREDRKVCKLEGDYQEGHGGGQQGVVKEQDVA